MARVDDLPASVDEIASGDRGDAVAPSDIGFPISVVEEKQEAVTAVIDVPKDLIAPTFYIDAYHLKTAGAKSLMEPFHLGHGGTAGRTPRRPKIEKDDLVAKVGQGDPPASAIF